MQSLSRHRLSISRPPVTSDEVLIRFTRRTHAGKCVLLAAGSCVRAVNDGRPGAHGRAIRTNRLHGDVSVSSAE
jgi:hypothetical protein